MTPRLLERRELPNGLALELWDESRKVAGDRWYVAVWAVVPVPLAEHQLDDVSPKVNDFIRREVGDHLYYQHREERHFVAEAEVGSLREELKHLFLTNSLSYLSRPDFPCRFVGRQVREVADKIECGKEYLERLVAALRRPNSRE